MISKKIAVVFIIISIVNLLAASSQRSEELSMLVKHIVDHERVRCVLSAKTCWAKNDELTFAKTVSIPIQMIKTAESIDLPVDENTNRQWFFVDMNCDRNSNFLSNVDEKYFAHPYRWIIVEATNNSIRNLTLLPGSDIILANRDEHSGKYILTQGNIYTTYNMFGYIEKMIRKNSGILTF